jgi:hypothetical protein
MCREGDHTTCGHWSGWVVSAWRRREGRVRLCQCPCHEDCPLRGQSASEQEWRAGCTCPGAPEWRQHFDEPA